MLKVMWKTFQNDIEYEMPFEAAGEFQLEEIQGEEPDDDVPESSYLAAVTGSSKIMSETKAPLSRNIEKISNFSHIYHVSYADRKTALGYVQMIFFVRPSLTISYLDS